MFLYPLITIVIYFMVNNVLIYDLFGTFKIHTATSFDESGKWTHYSVINITMVYIQVFWHNVFKMKWVSVNFHLKYYFVVNRGAWYTGVANIPYIGYVAHLGHCMSENIFGMTIVGIVYKLGWYVAGICKQRYITIDNCVRATNLEWKLIHLTVWCTNIEVGFNHGSLSSIY